MVQKLTNNKSLKAFSFWALVLFSSGMIYLMHFFSAVTEFGAFLQHNKFWLAINVVMVFSLGAFLYAAIGKAWITIVVYAVISLIWSIADYYTVLYHGSPLFPNEYANFKTAMEVAGGYSFAIDSDVIKIICIFAVVIVVAIFMMLLEKKEAPASDTKKSKHRISSLIVGAVGLILAVFTIIGPLKLKPETTMGWSWKDGVSVYGFWVCSIEDMNSTISDPYKMPEGYSTEAVSQLNVGKPAQTTEYPDIIVILNETFYDLDKFFDINPDVSPVSKFYSVENAVYGYAPSGGGTNDTEYELLLSNSLYLLNSTSPYNFVKFKDKLTVVDYARSLGYTTTAMHCGNKENYHRNIAYRDMGFDNIFLGADDFKYKDKNYKRNWLDSENYKDMLDYLDENTSSPQFVFLLTYQNHGGYTKNDDSLDTVHSGVDYGEKTSEVNEFMSSLALSSDAFYELTEKLKDRRPTVVVMVGDHAPKLEKYLTPRGEGYMAEMGRILVPYVIWTNYKTVPDEYGVSASIEDLVPMASDVAGLPLSPYYNKILELHDVVPLRTNNGIYVDAEGNSGSFSQESEYYKLMNEYYCMEYNLIGEKEDTVKELFIP